MSADIWSAIIYFANWLLALAGAREKAKEDVTEDPDWEGR
jgi:hypothetical protein